MKQMVNLLGQSIGRYHILEQIGAGGMATVYKAFDMQAEKDVAIKFIRPDRYTLEETEVTIRRFQREASLLSWLTQPTS
jgi:serine/threonine protein kinase